MIQKCLIDSLFDSLNIHTKTATDKTNKSKERDWDAGLFVASSINIFTLKAGPYNLTNSIFAIVGRIAPKIDKNK